MPTSAVDKLVKTYSNRDQTVRFVYVSSLRVEGRQTNILCKPKTLTTYELRQRATKYCRWEIMFVIRTVFALLSATPPALLTSYF
jgi:hypothetical protein